MNKEETDLIIAEQNKSTEEILKVIDMIKADLQELCDMRQRQVTELEQELEREKNLNKVLEDNNEQLRESNSYMFDTIALKSQQIEKLEKENAELKCECRRCIYSDSPCVLSDYEKDINGICNHFKDVFDTVAELRIQNTNANLKELEKEAEERATKFTGINFNEPDNYGSEKEVGHFSYYTGYLAGAEPREKRIAELEKENSELKAKNKWYSEQVCNKECAEVWGNLTKAKEIMNIAIEGIKYWGIIGGTERPFEKQAEMLFNLFLDKAEQFIKENK